MRESFSTEVVDLHFQAPNRNRRESRYYWDELNTLISAAGFRYIEFPYEPKWDFGGRSGIPLTMRSITVKFGSVENYLADLKAKGIDGISCIHLDPTLFCGGAIPFALGAFGHFAEEALEFAKEAGAILTLSVTPTLYSIRTLKAEGQSEEELFGSFLSGLKDMLNGLAVKAKEAGVKLCLKNEYWTLLAGEAIEDFLSGLDASILLDVDTANLYIRGVSIPDFIRRNRDRIGVVHFTDTAFTDDQDAASQVMPEFPARAATKVYRDIGDGKVDLKAAYETLKEIGYDGDIVYNCRRSYDVCRSLLRTRYFIDNTIHQ